MVIIRNIYKLLFASVLVAVLTCAVPAKRGDAPSDPRTAAEDRLNPVGFPGDDEVITGRQGPADKHGHISDTASVGTQGVESDETGSPERVEERQKAVFRVQVFASKSFDEAQGFAKQIEHIFPEGVFVEYQPPYYKVRVGEFRDSDQGERYLERVKRLGFENAWLVRVIK